MRGKYLWIVVVALLVLGFGVGRLSAASGTTDSSAPPGFTSSYALADIYNRLNDGTTGTQSTFTEPSVAPGTGTMYTLDNIMGVAPAVDDADGATAADVSLGKTFWGLTSGAWGLQTGTNTSGPVPKTGQTTSYATGDDGAWERGLAWPVPRFTDNGDGTVTDNLTGLVWLKNANCWGLRTWASALALANSFSAGFCGLTDGSVVGDWRLPNVREMQSLMDYSEFNPALPPGHPFTGVQADYYWSSTTVATDWSFTWRVHLGVGHIFYVGKAYSYYVWPVRGGQ